MLIRKLVDCKVIDNFSPVSAHLFSATCVKHEQGKANMEMTTSKYNTALLLAVNNGQTPLIELLVNQGNRLYICMCYLRYLV